MFSRRQLLQQTIDSVGGRSAAGLLAESNRRHSTGKTAAIRCLFPLKTRCVSHLFTPRDPLQGDLTAMSSTVVKDISTSFVRFIHPK
ncbi:hypothetical protein SV7mr_51800 [Stieleria bergensis]|uniref:Uncharacterized protein n=1 Tax=Stieleria bergensis TaxID=2528025 RepID=A0A517T2M4_9BACT|nr:hypothetical protein SV7mr_51800 [Planctomycetes bacterium SV_7m_r]